MRVEWAPRTRSRWRRELSLPVCLQRATLAASLLGAAYSIGCTAREKPMPPEPTRSTQAVAPRGTFVATAYSLHGKTASGTVTRPGVVAADPRVLPLGSQIRVRGAGAYSGTYTVADTGSAIGGRRIDVYIPNHAAARRFGRRTVRVELVHQGRKTRSVRSGGRPRRSAHRHQRAVQGKKGSAV
jgi:3D (Asp-Asp-Asp) domain-containing protein